MSGRVSYLDALRGRGFFLEFYDPEGERYGLPTYPYHSAPAGLLTIRQLRAKGLRPGGQEVAGLVTSSTRPSLTSPLWTANLPGVTARGTGGERKNLTGVLEATVNGLQGNRLPASG